VGCPCYGHCSFVYNSRNFELTVLMARALELMLERAHILGQGFGDIDHERSIPIADHHARVSLRACSADAITPKMLMRARLLHAQAF